MSSTELSHFLGRWLPKVEGQMRELLFNDEAAVAIHYGMLRYHLGWADEALRPQNYPAGKRLRPMLCLIACEAVGGDPVQALPAAAAIELLHNFSLIHDDIEDGDELRRHRPTLWKVWGAPQAYTLLDKAEARPYADHAMRQQHEVAMRALREVFGARTEETMLWALTDGLLERQA